MRGVFKTNELFQAQTCFLPFQDTGCDLILVGAVFNGYFCRHGFQRCHIFRGGKNLFTSLAQHVFGRDAMLLQTNTEQFNVLFHLLWKPIQAQEEVAGCCFGQGDVLLPFQRLEKIVDNPTVPDGIDGVQVALKVVGLVFSGNIVDDQGQTQS